MYELKFRYRFEAAHRFTQSCEDSCATPHGHTWHATLHLKTTGELNAVDMVEEFGLLKKPWRQFITETADHSFMHHAQDPLLPALREFIPQFRGLPFPGDPTTEQVARLFYEKALRLYEPWLKTGRLQLVGVTIEETPTNHVFYAATESRALDPSPSKTETWWQSSNPLARH